MDKRGYVSSSSLKKLRKLVDIGVPSEAEGRYLIVIIPSKKHLRALYRHVPLMRVGRDVLTLLADTINAYERALIHSLRMGIDKKILHVLYKLILGTLLFDLRDHNGVPQLIYYLSPVVH